MAQLERENAEYLIIRQSEENQLAAKSNQIARLNDSYQKALRKFSEGSQRDHIECPNCDTLNARLR